MKKSLTILVLPLFALLGACGSSHNSARAVINGQQLELAVQAVEIDAGAPTGPAISGFDGAMTSPLTVKIMFRSQNIFSDYLVIVVNDVVGAYRDFLGKPMPIGGGFVQAQGSFQGLPLAMFDGVVIFDQLSNYAGDAVSGQYEMQTGNGLLEGSFSGRVRAGY
jgi:hypothetical protein